jgi:hypothetical protein
MVSLEEEGAVVAKIIELGLAKAVNYHLQSKIITPAVACLYFEALSTASGMQDFSHWSSRLLSRSWFFAVLFQCSFQVMASRALVRWLKVEEFSWTYGILVLVIGAYLTYAGFMGWPEKML